MQNRPRPKRRKFVSTVIAEDLACRDADRYSDDLLVNSAGQLSDRYFRKGGHKLPSSFVYLLIPGLFSNRDPLYFVGTKKFFSKMGLACHIAKIHSEAYVAHNAWELKQYMEELYWGSGKRVMLPGHSKGGVHAAAALSIYW